MAPLLAIQFRKAFRNLKRNGRRTAKPSDSQCQRARKTENLFKEGLLQGERLTGLDHMGYGFSAEDRVLFK